MKKRFFMLAATVLALFSLCLFSSRAQAAETVASGACGENLTWVLDDEGTLTISGTGTMMWYDPSRPSPWDDHRSSIHKLVICEGVTSIGDYALHGCSNLTSIIFPKSLTSIGSQAFHNCDGLTSVSIPANITVIGSAPFYACSNLTGIWVDENNLSYCSDEKGVLYDKNMTSLIQTPRRISGSYVLPAGVTSIEDFAFYECDGLTEITLPSGMVSVGNNAFRGCSKLASVTFLGNLTHLGSGAFQYCSSLTSINLPETVTEIGSFAFTDCSSLAAINIPSSISVINDSVFSSCTSLASITIPAGVTSIGSSAFADCTSLTSITIPASVTSIGYSAFADCTILTSITLSEGLTSIGNGAFIECTSLTSITLPDSVKTIDYYAFSDCTSLTSVTLSESLTSINDSTFENCTSLASINIPASVTTIGKDAFKGCKTMAVYITDPSAWCKVNFENNYSYPLSNYASQLHIVDENGNAVSKVTLDSSVTAIPNYAFKNCASLAEITIPDGVTVIGNYAFVNCGALASIDIPGSVTKIGSRAFTSCRALTSVTLRSGLQAIGSLAFASTKITAITIPGSVTSIGTEAFAGCNALASITIENGLMTIGAFAFSSTGITSITIPASVTGIGGKVFNMCPRLESIWVDENNEFYCSDEMGVLYSKDMTTLVKAPTMLSGNYNVPNTVITIGATAFEYCNGLTGVTLPESLIAIQDYAFFGCNNLTTISIPASVTTIWSCAFASCQKLTGIWADKNSTIYCSDEYGVLYTKAMDTLVQAPGGLSGGYKIPATVTTIKNYAFGYCEGLTDISMSTNVTTIESQAFYGCSKLTDVYYSGSKTQRDAIAMDAYHEELLNATWHYNSPGYGIAQNADGTWPTVSGCPCALGNGNHIYGCTQEEITWSPWTSTTSLPTTTGNYYLTGDVTLSAQQTISVNGAVVRLDLNGKTVQNASNKQTIRFYRFFASGSNPGTNGTLSITDNAGGGLIKNTSSYDQGGIVWMAKSGCTFILFAGTLDGREYSNRGQNATGGSLVHLDAANTSFYMYGGTIYGSHSDNTATEEDEGFTLGKLAQNTVGSTSKVYSRRYATVGPVFVSGRSSGRATAHIYGGIIYGAEVMANRTITVDTSSGSATYNQITKIASSGYGKGGAIYVNDYGTLNIHGGIIYGGNAYTITFDADCNTATADVKAVGQGGAIYVDNLALVNMYGGNISGGHADGNGGNVYVNAGGTFNMPTSDAPRGGYIVNGSSNDQGGNLFSAGTINLTYGLLTGGTAPNGGNLAINANSESGNTTTLDGIQLSNGIASDKGGNLIINPTGVCVVDIRGGTTLKNGSAKYGGNLYINTNNYGNTGPNVTVNMTGLTLSRGSSAQASPDLHINCTAPTEEKAAESYVTVNINEGCSLGSRGPGITGDLDNITINTPHMPLASGTYGSYLTWELVDDRTLVVSGNGPMYSYGYEDPVPWHKYRQWIQKVVLNDGVTNIGTCAFSSCINLVEISIPDSVSCIEQYAFEGCDGLTSITLSNNVTTILYGAFSKCVNLTGIWVSEDNPALFSDSNGVLFSKDKTLLIQAPGALSGSYSIPGTVTQIQKCAFDSCPNLINVTIPSGITDIPHYMFYECTSLTHVNIPDTVTSIGYGAFYKCSSLAGTLTIPGSVTSIDNRAFYGCSGLTGLTLSNGVESIGDYAFQGCSGLTGALGIPETLTSVGYRAFNDCKGLTSVMFYGGAISLEANVFAGCSGLTHFAIAEGVTQVGDHMFENCTELTSIQLPNSVTHIGKNAFSGCIELPDIDLPDSVTSIGDNAFTGCSNLTSISIPGSVTSIGSTAFQDCPNLKHVYYGGSEENRNNVSFGDNNDHLKNAKWHYNTETDLQFTSASVLLHSNLSINFKVDSELFTKDRYKNPYVVFEFDGVTTTVTDYIIQDGKLVFSFHNIAPDQIGQAVSATLYASRRGQELHGIVRDYSVKDYCYNTLASYNGEKADQLRTLLVDLLNYGAASQIYSGKNTDALVNADLTETQRSWGTSSDPELSSIVNLEYAKAENATVAWKGAGLALQESIMLRIKFQAEAIEGLKVKVTVGDDTYTIKPHKFVPAGTEGMYYIYFNKLTALHLREPVYFTVYKGNTAVSDTLCYSVESYAQRYQSSDNTALAELVKAVIRYGDAACAYAN